MEDLPVERQEIYRVVRELCLIKKPLGDGLCMNRCYSTRIEPVYIAKSHMLFLQLVFSNGKPRVYLKSSQQPCGRDDYIGV
jgi:hypothetical protein